MASYPSYDQLAAAVPVDIMPGPNDPANFSLPQQVTQKHSTIGICMTFCIYIPYKCFVSS